MAWFRSSTSAPHIPAASSSPEVPHQGRLRVGAFNLIDVVCVRGGSWKAVCECGDAPEVFAQQQDAWLWINDHRCPVIEPDARAV